LNPYHPSDDDFALRLRRFTLLRRCSFYF